MTKTKIHWSFWIICIVALLWNLMGCINFVMQMNPEMVANFPDAAKSLISTRPEWSTAAFAIAVFGGLIGDIFLILRKALALYLFIASILGVAITNIHTLQVTTAMDILVGSSMSLVISAFLIWYTMLVIKKGWVK